MKKTNRASDQKVNEEMLEYVIISLKLSDLQNAIGKKKFAELSASDIRKIVRLIKERLATDASYWRIIRKYANQVIREIE